MPMGDPQIAKGVDNLIAKLANAEKIIAKMGVDSASIAKNFGQAAGSLPSGGGGNQSHGSAGGNVLSKMGGFTTPASSGKYGKDTKVTRTIAHNGYDEETDTEYRASTSRFGKGVGKINKMSKKLGLADIYLDPKSPEEAAYNKQRVEGAKNLLYKSFGIDRELMGGVYDVKKATQGKREAQRAMTNIMGSIPTPQDALDLMTNVQNAMGNFMPSVSESIQRTTGYYQAALANGPKQSRNQVDNQTFNTMNAIGGITSVGSDANVANFLAQQGMTAVGKSKLTGAGDNSTYQQTIRSIANAGRYLNISNEQAATSIEGLTSGKGSANMLRNFGIYTADLTTGKEKTQGQIFEELAQRLTAGRKSANVEQTQASIRRGALGATIDSFFQGDAAGAQMFKQYMVDRAGGKKMDLANNSAMSSIYGDQYGNNRNPLNAQMSINASDTGALKDAQEQYLKGIEGAVLPLQALNQAAGKLASTFMGLPNALMQTLTNHRTVSGIMGGINATTQYAGKTIAGVTEALINGSYDTPWGAAATLTEAGLIGAAGIAGAVPTMASMAGQALMGTVGNVISYQSPGGHGGKGGATVGATGGRGAGSGTGVSEFALPSRTVTQGFGASAFASSAYASGTHDGIDYDYSYGDSITAIADGVVSFTQSGIPSGTDPKSFGESGHKPYGRGNHVIIDHQNGYKSHYYHLSKVSVAKGDPVKKGQEIGKAGNSGYCLGSTGYSDAQHPYAGTHLHLGLEKGGRMVNPATGAAAAGQGASSDTTGSSSSSNSSSSSKDKVGDVTIGDASAAASAASGSIGSLQFSGSAAAAASIVQNLYSGNTTGILAAISQMAANVGVTDAASLRNLASTGYVPIGNNAGAQTAIGANSGSNYLSGGNSTGSNGSSSNGNGGYKNQVNINVSVPNATQTEAEKFAQYVGQYLQNDTLMSNTGSI